MNKKYKDIKERKHRLAKENAGLAEDSKIYKKQLELLRSSLAKSHRLVVQREFRNAPPRVVLDRILSSSETKEGIEVTRDWLTDENGYEVYPSQEPAAPAMIVESIIQHEKETRDFMQQILEEQRGFFYEEIKGISKSHDKGSSSSNDNESMEKMRKMFEHITSDLLSNIQTSQSTVLEKLITEFSTRQEYILKLDKESVDQSIEKPISSSDNKSNTDINKNDVKPVNDNSHQLKITFLEQRITDYEQRAEEWEVLQQRYEDDIITFTLNAKKDSSTIIDLKRNIIRYENEKREGGIQLLLCSLQKVVFKRYSKYFNKWCRFSVMSHQLETENNYHNIIERITIEYDQEQEHLTQESFRKQKELEDLVESKRNIINEARINHTKLLMRKAKEEELEKRSRRAEASIMTSIDFSTNAKVSTATECQTVDATDKISVTTSMSELPPQILKGIKDREKEESLKKIDEKYLTVNHEDELMIITQNKIISSIPQNKKEEVHSSLAAEITQRLKTFHF